MNSPKGIWITWETHRRTIELARLLPDVRLYVIQMNAHRGVRYPYLLFKTFWVLLRCRPKLVFVQNPSVVLTIFALLMKAVWRFRLAVDAHNEGLMPFHGRHNWLLPIYHWLQKGADWTIVTNGELAKEVASNGGRPFVLADPIPQLMPTAVIPLKGTYNIVFVCTFEKDEPYEEVILGARYLEPSIYIYITGRYQKASPALIQNAPANVVFSGFLPDQEYTNLLHSSDAVMDLTLMQNCLVCGAYEAVALGKPIIVSDTPALRSYFYKGAVYTGNSCQDIANSIRHMIAQHSKLKDEMSDLRKEVEAAWGERLHQLKEMVGFCSGVHPS